MEITKLTTVFEESTEDEDGGAEELRKRAD